MVHFYQRQIIEDFIQLGDNAVASCQKNGRFRDDRFDSFIRTHVQNALDFYHTAVVLLTAEISRVESSSSPRESKQFQRTRLSSLRGKQIDSVVSLLRRFLLFCVVDETPSHPQDTHNDFSSALRDLNTLLRYSAATPAGTDDILAGEILLHAAARADVRLNPDHDLLWRRTAGFLESRGKTINFLPRDPRNRLYLAALAFFPPLSSNFAGGLNELGRFLQSRVPAGSVYCYKEAAEAFRRSGDWLNVSVVLCNLSVSLNGVLEGGGDGGGEEGGEGSVEGAGKGFMKESVKESVNGIVNGTMSGTMNCTMKEATTGAMSGAVNGAVKEAAGVAGDASIPPSAAAASTQPNNRPASQPTNQPINQPNRKPINQQNNKPTHIPTHIPTNKPTHKPTHIPTNKHTTETTTETPTHPRQFVYTQLRWMNDLVDGVLANCNDVSLHRTVPSPREFHLAATTIRRYPAATRQQSPRR